MTPAESHVTTPAESRVADLRHDCHRHPESAWSTFASTARIVDESARILVEFLSDAGLAGAGRRS